MSADSAHLVKKIEKYAAQLKDGQNIGHALHRLEKIDMTVDLLTKTGVGKVVNRITRNDDHEEYHDQALKIVNRWKRIAQEQQREKERSPSPVPERRIKKEVKEEEYGGGYPGDSYKPSTNNNDRKRQRVKEEQASPSSSYEDEKRDRERKKSKPAPAPANAFLAALASGDAVKADKPKKLKPFTLDLDITNYRPMPSVSATKQAAAKPSDEFQTDPAAMYKPRNGQTKIYAGRRKETVLSEVPRLFDSCIRVLQNHINDPASSFHHPLPMFVPYDVARPVLEKATWQNLADIERKNPNLAEDSDELWRVFCEKRHAGKQTRDDESWKEMFMRCEGESEHKLKALSARISKDGKAAGDRVRKVVAITDVKMPRGSRRGAVIDMPSALQVSKARKEIFDTGSKAQLCQINSTVVARNSTLGSSSHRSSSSRTVEAVKAGPKKGALMGKVRKMLGIKRSK